MNRIELPFEPARAGRRTEILRLVQAEASVIPYRLVRARRRTIGISIKSGEVEARAPRYVPLAEIENFIREKRRWIAARMAEESRRPVPFCWREGAALPLLGRPVILAVQTGNPAIMLDGARLLLSAGEPQHWRTQVISWLKNEALERFAGQVSRFARALGLPCPRVAISNASTRWGSCARQKNGTARILLNWRLVHLAQPLIEYVAAHETAHLKELNHSPRFWAVVARLCPDHVLVRRELVRLGRTLPEL